ncbi:MAG TPA: alpha/beta fold hydrolase [Symbiobacteriaceae bacterium]|nr:alpha/beta fold hydrolase [Symbiobacteriaceae bacterium]
MESTAVTLGESGGRFVSVDDLHLHVVEDGNPAGVPVVLVHGFAGSTFCWRYQIAPLADAGYRVLAIDLPGFGLSSRPKGAWRGTGRWRLPWPAPCGPCISPLRTWSPTRWAAMSLRW